MIPDIIKIVWIDRCSGNILDVRFDGFVGWVEEIAIGIHLDRLLQPFCLDVGMFKVVLADSGGLLLGIKGRVFIGRGDMCGFVPFSVDDQVEHCVVYDVCNRNGYQFGN